MSPSVEPPRGGVYARRAVGALSRRFPDSTSSAYCVWQFERAGASGWSWPQWWRLRRGRCGQLGGRMGEWLVLAGVVGVL